MTRKEMINFLNECAKDLEVDHNLEIWGMENLQECADAFREGAKALEQEFILDKIRDEIVDTGAYEQEVNGKTEFLKGITYCLGVIDMYKTESDEGAEE